jgi:DNA polymerase III epsilon subunit-like protein
VETTGFALDDVIVEIGAVELFRGVRTGAQFHSYIAHRKDSVSWALECHGLDERFLSDKPPATFVVPSFMRWLQGAVLVAHNAAFDQRMLNAELGRLGMPRVPDTAVLCTKQLFGASPPREMLKSSWQRAFPADEVTPGATALPPPGLLFPNDLPDGRTLDALLGERASVFSVYPVRTGGSPELQWQSRGTSGLPLSLRGG